MLYEMKKAVQAFHRPGIDTSPWRMVRNVAPYYLPGEMKVSSPLTIYWSINSVCNLRCKMCDVGMFNEEGMFFKNLRIDRKLHEVDIEVFKRVVDEVKDDKPFMALNSTEPLMYKPLAEAIAYCTKNDLKTGVTTGAYTLPRQAEALAEAGLSRLSVSMDGPPDIHNHIRGRKDSFEQAYAGIEAFAAAARKLGRRPEIYLNCTITNMNHHRLVDFYEAIAPLPVTAINFTYMWFIDPETATEQNALYGDRYAVSPSCYSEWIDPHQVDIDLLYDQIQQIKDRPKVHFSPLFSREELKRYFHKPNEFVNPAGRCLASWFFLQVLADGGVIVYTRCHSKPVGNINDQSIAEIWNGEEMKGWRRFIQSVGKMPMCKRCDLAY
jgi:MoaA/NifB/PqqE/SkfB family radical SAM enzyme